MNPHVLVGVLALQGAFDAHARRLAELGVESRLVKDTSDLDDLDAIAPAATGLKLGLMNVQLPPYLAKGSMVVRRGEISALRTASSSLEIAFHCLPSDDVSAFRLASSSDSALNSFSIVISSRRAN